MHQLLSFLGGQQPATINVSGPRPAAAAMLAAQTAEKTGRPVLCIVPSEAMLGSMEQDCNLFTSLPVFSYPGYEIPPYTPLSPDSSTTASRLSTLYKILSGKGQFVLVVSSEALLRKILPQSTLNELAELVIRGEQADPQHLLASLVRSGYEQVSLVQSSGEFAVRGGIIDIYPPVFAQGQDGIDAPVRLDFFGETVESIRYFDPITQRSLKEIEEAIFLPVRDILFPDPATSDYQTMLERFDSEGKKRHWDSWQKNIIREKIKTRTSFPGIEFFLPLFYEKLSAPLDILPENTIIFSLDPRESAQTVQLVWERINRNYQEACAAHKPALPPDSLFLTEKELEKSLHDFSQVCLYDFISLEPEREKSLSIPCGNHLLLKQQLELSRKKEGFIAPLAHQIREWQQQNDKVVLACRSEKHARHLAEMLSHYHLALTTQQAPLQLEQAGAAQLTLVSSPVSGGFDLPSQGLHVLSETELFGEKRLGARKKKVQSAAKESIRFEELHPRDFVVHTDHGIGIFEGIVNMSLNGVANDFLQITYEGNDKLYVPVDRLNSISKYQGISDKDPQISKLGSKVWIKTKQKVTEAVWKVAQELLDIYARRKLAKGHAFSVPDSLYNELEETFPYDETPGQLKAINEVIADLSSELTMDRLVCGDVGYGKTEVAIRAAFKVIEDGFQVAMLVPTTVLAEQHAQSFRERFAGFPVQIECLNRFRSDREQKEAIANLATGKADMVIGTHRILSKDVIFKRIGLLIIDEEHRFGVTHKEKIKKLKSSVDVLTLTATPIPRTLQLSLLGIRDLSVISSPPSQRRAVKTFVAKHDDLVIKEAVIKEVQRKGQVFIVHNRVQSIHEMAGRVQKLVPEARIAVAHGQMPGKQLEDIMVSFIQRDVDVLVCTTIIESGLDIPNANTIIITRADRFGLAEIYQLRGRVGRSSEQAYAYLLVPSLDGLSRDARQRLRALMEYNELGGGFKLAMSDLQIRGGGSILGKSQSGNIAAVGYDLYLDLLQKTVEDLKRRGKDGEAAEEELDFEPEINLGISAFIPDHYITDSDQRYIAYRKITSIRDDLELEDLQDELRDRYGDIPEETVNLLRIITIKFVLRKMKICKLERGTNTLVYTFLEQTPVNPARILELVTKSKNSVRFTPDGKLIVPARIEGPDSLFAEIKKVLQALD
ncbi:MAG: transcription-repair coupling factor [Deltaproteobacteria bacterium]|nr:transcription-repair coupling factor [Deltaproteobacteria bacterium]